MKTIETARTLLADASPELRRAVGKVIYFAGKAGFDNGKGEYSPKRFAKDVEYQYFARELIEAGK